MKIIPSPGPALGVYLLYFFKPISTSVICIVVRSISGRMVFVLFPKDSFGIEAVYPEFYCYISKIWCRESLKNDLEKHLNCTVEKVYEPWNYNHQWNIYVKTFELNHQ